MLLMIAYDLHKADGRDYTTVENAIKQLGAWAHLEQSVWILDTAEMPEQVVARLVAVGHGSDRYFVAQLRPEANWWSTNLQPAVVAWLKDPARRWS
jgi:hypothetical protein